MPPRIIDGWESPRPSRIHGWKWEYYRIIGQIDLEIRTDEEPQTKFVGEITDKSPSRMIRTIAYDESEEQWKYIKRDGNLIVSRLILDHEFNTIKELADFMVAKAEEIDAGRSA